MSIFYTKETANGGTVKGSNNDLFTREFTYTTTGTEGSGDGILITKLQKGSKVVGYSINTEALGYSGSLGTTVGGGELFSLETGAAGVSFGFREKVSAENIYLTTAGSFLGDRTIKGVIYFTNG